MRGYIAHSLSVQIKNQQLAPICLIAHPNVIEAIGQNPELFKQECDLVIQPASGCLRSARLSAPPISVIALDA